jgi:accessory gene regulator protein AgrB
MYNSDTNMYILDKTGIQALNFLLICSLKHLIKGILLFVLAMALDTVIPVVVALLVGSGFRSLAGGAHSTAYVRCLVLSLAIYLLTGWTINIRTAATNV